MKTFNAVGKLPSVVLSIVALAVVIASVATLSRARAQAIGITIVNNSSRDIRHLFLSPPDSNNWGPDQLHDSTITPGNSFTVTEVSCPQGSIKVIAEDENGCFLYQTVSCGDNATWTISNEATPDCGG